MIFEEDSLITKQTSSTKDSCIPTFTPDNYYFGPEPVPHPHAPQYQPDVHPPEQLPDSPITPRTSPPRPLASTPPTTAPTQLTQAPLSSAHMISHLKQNSPPHLSSRRTSSRSTKGQPTTTKFHDESAYMSAFMTQLSEPLSIDEAVSGPDSADWRTAMESEYDSFIKNNT